MLLSLSLSPSILVLSQAVGLLVMLVSPAPEVMQRASNRQLTVLFLRLATEAARIGKRDRESQYGNMTIFPNREGMQRTEFIPNLHTWVPNVTSPHA